MYGDPQFSQGIRDTAGALGMDPVDLATIISYETAGTFSPTQAGPTTQWGQHRGLIQFGEPQARQYGVDWNNPMGSQLGPDGAIVRYYRDNGWEPGMGLMNAYSIVNAGGPNRFNRSDANNGGAPGSVADKVNEQMGGHRQNAMRLLGGTGDTVAAGNAENDTLGATMSTRNAPARPYVPMTPQEEGRESLWKRMGVFKDDDKRQRLAMALEGMTLNPNDGLMRGLEADISGRADQAGRNRTAEWLRANGSEDLADALAGGSIEGGAAVSEYMRRQQPAAQAAPIEINGQLVDPTTGQVIGDYRTEEQGYTQVRGSELGYEGASADVLFNVGPDNEVTRIGGGDTNVEVHTGDTGPRVGTIPQGYQMMQDPETGAYSMQPISGGPEDASTARASAAANAATGSVNVLETIQDLRTSVEGNPNTTTGFLGNMLQGIAGTEAYDAAALVTTVKSNLAFDALNALRAASPTGGALGGVSAPELKLLESEIANLDLGQSQESILRSIERIETQYTQILNKAYATGDPAALDNIFGGRPSFVTGITPTGGGADIDALLNQYGSD